MLVHQVKMAHFQTHTKFLHKLKKSSVLIAVLLFFTAVQSIQAQINNTDYRVEISSTNMGVCGGSNDGSSTVTITAKSTQLHTFKIIFDLPEGINYKTGTAVINNQTGSGDLLLSEFDITDLNQPTFQIERPSNANWQISDVVTITFEKTGDCDAVQFSYNGGLFKDVHTINYIQDTTAKTANNSDLTSNGYTLLKAYLAVNDITAVDAFVGDITNRNVVINNSGNGSISQFDHVVEISPGLQANYELSFNGTVLTPTISGNFYTYSINLNDAPFVGQIGDGDNLFENENITLVEKLVLTDCTDNQSTNHSPRWGCTVGTYCQIGASIPGFIGFNQEWSDISFQTISDPRPRWDAPVTYTYRLENNASAANAYNVNFNIGYTWDNRLSGIGFNPMFGDDNDTQRQLSNFRFTGGSAFTPQRWINTPSGSSKGLGSYLVGQDFFTTDPDGPGGLQDLDGDGLFDDLLPGDFTEINVDLSMLPDSPTCAPDKADYVNSHSLKMDAWAVNSCGGSNKSIREELQRHYVNRAALFNEDFPEDYDLDAEDGSVFNLSFIGNFIASEQSPTCNGIEMFSNDASTIYKAVLDVPNGVTLDVGADARYVQVGNQIIFTETQLADFEYNSYWLRIPINFELNIDCSTYSGPEELNLNYTTSYESSCYNTDLHCGSFNITTHCPNSCSAPMTTSFDADRTTTGWTDETMTTKVVLDPNVHATKYYMPKDEMAVSTSAVMQNSTQDNLSFEMRYITESGVSMQDIIAFTGGTITIHDLSTGSPQTFPITNTPVITTQGTNDNRFTLDLSTYQNLISPTYQYGEGLEADEISLNLTFQFKEDFPEEAFLYQFHTFQGRFFSLDGTGTEIDCGAYNERAHFFQNEINITADIDNKTEGCDEKWLYVGLAQASSVDDKFPDEFRPPLLWSSTTIEIPMGMHFNNLVSSYGYPSLMPENEDPTSWNNGLNYSVSGNIVTITPGPRFVHLDQGGNNYPSVSINLTATSATPALSSHNISVSYDEYAYADSPVTKTETDTKDFTYNQPVFFLTSDNPTEIGNSELEGFTVDICKQNSTEIANNWLRVDTGANYTITNAYLVNGGTETALTFTTEGDVTYIEFGDMEGGTWICRQIRFEGTYNSSSPIDLNISHNYDCIAYPTSYGGIPYFDEEVFTLNPVPAAIQLQILNQPNTTVDTCTDFNITLEARNAGEGDLISPIVNFDVPGDISALLINGLTIEFPRGSGNIETLTPTISGNNVSINLLDHSFIAAKNGIPGSLNAASIDEQIAVISLTLNAQCNYVSNTGTAYTITGNSPFGDPATGSGSRTSANPIILTGAEPPYSTNNSVSVSNTARLEGCEAETVSVNTIIIDGVSGNDDYVRVVLPDGIQYVTSSFTSTSALPLTFVSANTVGSHQEIELKLPQGATSADTLTYGFDISNQSNSCTGTADIDLTTYVTTNALSCMGVSCGTTKIATGNATIPIETFKSEIAVASPAPQATYVNNGTDYTYDLDFSIENIGAYTVASGATYAVYCTDASDNKSGTAIYTGSLDSEIISGSTINEIASFTTSDFCGAGGNLLIELEPSVGNCFCNTVSFLIASVDTSADLSLNKSVSDTNPNISDVITFTIDLANAGPNDATNVSVEDIVPVGYTVDIATISNSGTLSGNTITWNLATVTSGTTSLTYDVSVIAPTGATDEYKNIAQVTASDQTDPNSTPNNDDGDQSEDDEDSVDTVSVSTQADLSLDKSVSDTNPNISDVITFTIDLANAGPNDATNVSIEDVVPVGYTVDVATISDGGTLSGNTITWDLATVTSGTTSLTYDVSVNAPTGATDEYKNLAQVTASDQTDPNSTPNNDDGDQSEDDEDSVDTVSVSAQADLSLDKSVSDTNPDISDVITFTIDLANAGPNDATNVSIEDVVPVGYTVDVATISNSGTLSGNTITWNLATVTSGTTSLTYDVSVNAPTGATDEYKNIAQVTASDQTDPNSTPNNDDGDQSEDDEDSVDTISINNIDLSLNKTLASGSNPSPNINESITYEIVIANAGPENATGIVIEDYIPSGLILDVSSISNGGTFTNNTITWNIASLSVESITLSYSAMLDIPTGTENEYKNVAQVTQVDQPDSDSSVDNYNANTPNEDDESEYEVATPSIDISINKTVSSETAAIGDEIIFTVTASNIGSLEATNLSIEENIPNGFVLTAQSSDIGAYDSQTGFWDISVLLPGETAELLLTVTVQDADEYTNIARVDYVDQMDQNTTNDQDEATVTLNEPLEEECLVIFNEFSPNGDGSNEYFFIECIEDYPNNNLQVFNRWGTLVYETKGYKNDWDGTSQGRATVNGSEKLPVGTYYYILVPNEDINDAKTGWLYITR
ncbi:conserved repeat domain-containing protein/gliding motility-associated C-terminal domain-containing protein [Maribacter aquivivus]|uniref:Conserved repeat domain-containing protein/gliding motility-associated C-terminal domain-containing protein n=1 Tax=Maribacter aquivivus TaxID=228958 RepID=A0A1M6KHS9_9FLAO|nr:gliding motility-associated C-terminal domain-containing protein [Maribacter aquivivus]SHJ58489.1 conserved repeat domain-containing protein/gliding motility-associated C-terminal domain-containing protein [Maribacter aquivivus]